MTLQMFWRELALFKSKVKIVFNGGEFSLMKFVVVFLHFDIIKEKFLKY